MAGKTKKPMGKKRSYRKSKKTNRKANMGTIRPYLRSEIMPRSQLLKVRNAIECFIPSGKIAALYYAQIYAAQLNQPFSSGSPVNGPSFGTATLTAGSSINSTFVGQNSMQQFYNSYKVYTSKLSITCRSESSADTVEVCIFPYVQTNTTPVGSIEMYQAVSQPFAKRKVCYNSNTGKDNTIICFNKAHEVLGWTKQQYKNYIANVSSFTTTPDSVADWNYLIYWQTLDNTALSGNLVFEIVLERVIQFFNPNQQL